MRVKCAVTTPEKFINSTAEWLLAAINQNGTDSLLDVSPAPDGNVEIRKNRVLLISGGRASIVQWLNNYGNNTTIRGTGSFWLAACRHKKLFGKNQVLLCLMNSEDVFTNFKFNDSGVGSSTGVVGDWVNGVNHYESIRRFMSHIGRGGQGIINARQLANAVRNYFDDSEYMD